MHEKLAVKAVFEWQGGKETVLATPPILAGLVDRSLAVEICPVCRKEHLLGRVGAGKDVELDRFAASLLAGPPGNEKLLSVMTDAVDVADNAANTGLRTGRLRPGGRDAKKGHEEGRDELPTRPDHDRCHRTVLYAIQRRFSPWFDA
jgi:hypothetical protein